MKTSKNSVKYFLLSLLGLGVVLLISCDTNNVNQKVLKAYELRLDGNADSAEALLDKVLKSDSTNAMAWYELARTKHHIGLGNPRELAKGLENIQLTIGKAVEHDNSNVIYAFYKGVISYTIAYVSVMRNLPDSKKMIDNVITDFKTVLNMKPDYHEATLYLIEILSMPADMGGDSLEAEKYTQELENTCEVCGAKARELILPQEVDRVEFWQKVKEKHENNAKVFESLGKAYLYSDNITDATKCFESAIKVDSTKNVLLIDIGRYYMMMAMQSRVQLDSVAHRIESSFEAYLKSIPEPINPLKAFVIGKLAGIKFRIGDKEEGEKLQQEAMVLDPHYSKAFATPSQILFDSPDKISHVHAYFSRPF